MTTKTRNEYIALVIVLLIIGFLIYHYMFPSNSAPVTDTQATLQGTLANSSSTAEVDINFLPYGLNFDTKVLQNQSFTSLVPPVQFIVNPSDLGVSNPFNQGSTANNVPNTSSSSATTSSSSGQPSAVIPSH